MHLFDIAVIIHYVSDVGGIGGVGGWVVASEPELGSVYKNKVIDNNLISLLHPERCRTSAILCAYFSLDNLQRDPFGCLSSLLLQSQDDILSGDVAHICVVVCVGIHTWHSNLLQYLVTAVEVGVDVQDLALLADGHNNVVVGLQPIIDGS